MIATQPVQVFSCVHRTVGHCWGDSALQQLLGRFLKKDLHVHVLSSVGWQEKRKKWESFESMNFKIKSNPNPNSMFLAESESRSKIKSRSTHAASHHIPPPPQLPIPTGSTALPRPRPPIGAPPRPPGVTPAPPAQGPPTGNPARPLHHSQDQIRPQHPDWGNMSRKARWNWQHSQSRKAERRDGNDSK